jgi:voltage-gated potassium channel Kch
VLLADSEFRHELEAQIQPFEGLLLGLFFMAVGMSINLTRVMAEPVTIAIGVLVLMAVKFGVLFSVGMRPGKLEVREALLMASVLALGGEFAFVVFGDAEAAGLLDAVLRDRLVAIVSVSMALTPPLLIAMTWLVGKVRTKPERPYDRIDDQHAPVLIAGFGRFGQIVARLLTAQHIPFVAIEHSPEQVDFMRRFGNQLYYGDPSRLDLLRAAGAAHVKVFVIALEDVEINLKAVRLIRAEYPRATVLARARNRRHAWELMDLGVEVVRETFFSSLFMGTRVLVALGTPETIAKQRVERFREHDEALLRTQHAVYDDEAALVQTSQEARKDLEQLFAADRGEGVLGGIVDRGERTPSG